jgi:nonsense-mediated mRNA decay protein 3
MSFLQSAVPTRCQTSQQLISSDVKAGTANFKFTYSAEIVPVCKDDLIVLPLKLAKQVCPFARGEAE